MVFFKRLIILTVLVLMVMPFRGVAQYQFTVAPFFSYFTDLKRYEIGFNGVASLGEFSGTIPFGGLGSGMGDTTFTKKFGFTNIGGYIGTSIPFKATGHISCWAMSIGLNFNMLSWPGLNLVYHTDGTTDAAAPLLTANTMQFGLPIGVEWKVGCDAICTRRLPFAASFGAGVIPQYSITNLANVQNVNAGSAFNCAPYIKAEVAENLGICVKFRVMYTMGDVTLIDVNHYIPGVTDGPFKVTSTSNICLSVIIMPFSVGWKETAWWNTHDTYNLHDRLN